MNDATDKNGVPVKEGDMVMSYLDFGVTGRCKVQRREGRLCAVNKWGSALALDCFIPVCIEVIK